MREELQVKINELKDYIGVTEKIINAISIVVWDMQTNMPKKALEKRSGVVGELSSQIFNKSTSDELKEFIEYLEGNINELDQVSKRMVEKLREDYDLTKKIPADRYKECSMICAMAQGVWEEAKEKNDFNLFSPHLAKIVEFQKEFVGYWGYEKNKYDTLLNQYEKGFTTEKLDKIFSELRDEIITLLDKINKSSVKVDSSKLSGKFEVEKQKELSHYILDIMGFDMDAGRLDESVHPFTTNFTNKDVRLTTNYVEKEFTYALYSTIHEGGHGLYEQNIGDNLENTGLSTGTSMGIHESQSRFYENIIGRSKEFCSFILPKAKEMFPQFEGVSEDEFYKAMNKVEPSLIRTEADELTYSLHIIIRYEIEKALINGEVEVQDLPKLWNEKYKEYLGIEPETDALGVLQDVHWAGGSFGYFPSYALGNLYGAQMLNKILKDIPNVYDEVRNGNLSNVKKWLGENVHVHGSLYTPAELIEKITGEELNAKYFVEYLKDKYSKIYELNN
ncbi:MAG: carboxypeptidase M32 [Clostridium sp.]